MSGRTTMSRLPDRKTRGEGAAEMSCRFLQCELTDDGMAALAAELDQRLAVPGASGANLREIGDLICDHLDWLADGSTVPSLPAFVNLTKPAQERFRHDRGRA